MSRIEGPKCTTCDDSGSVSAVHKTKRGASSFSFACPENECWARVIKNPRGIQWSATQHEDRYHLVGENKTVPEVWKSIFENKTTQQQGAHSV